MKKVESLKYAVWALSALILSSVYTACDDDNDSEDTKTATNVTYDALDRISVSDTTFNVMGGDIQLRVHDDVNGVGVSDIKAESSDDSWCIIKKSDFYISVWVMPNYGLDKREAIVTLTQGEKIKSFRVEQEQHIGILAEKDTVEVDFKSGNLQIPFFANTEYSVSEPSDSWLKAANEGEEESGLKVLNYAVSENKTKKVRTATITVTAKEGKDKINFVIIQGVDTALAVIDKAENYDFNDSGRRIEIKVKSRLDITVTKIYADTDSKEWINIAKEVSGTDDTTTYTFELDAFTSKIAKREVMIVFENTEGVKDTINISQSRKFFLNKESYSLAVNKETTIKHTTTLRDSTLEWISSDPNIVTVDEKGKLKAIARGVAVITAKITAGSEACEDFCYVNVTDDTSSITDKVKVSRAEDSFVVIGNTITFKGNLIIENSLDSEIVIDKIVISETGSEKKVERENLGTVFPQKSTQVGPFAFDSYVYPCITLTFTVKNKTYILEDYSAFFK